MERLADLQYKGFDAMRSRRAAEIAREPGTAADFDGLKDARQCLVVTFKRSGEGVPTPVNFGLSEDGRRLYFRSEARSAKVRRLRRDPHVRVCPCNMRGKPKGASVEGTARVVDRAEQGPAEAAVAGNWTASMKPVERSLERLPLELCYVEVTPSVPATTEEVR